MPYETILTETPAPGVGLARLNRPEALNALNGQLTGEFLTRSKPSTPTPPSSVWC